MASCDPLLQNCTNTAQGCYLTSTGPACITAGNVAIGASCTSGNCVKGAICLGTTQAANCHQYCNLDGGTPNCTGTTCGGVTNQAGMQQPWGACQ